MHPIPSRHGEPDRLFETPGYGKADPEPRLARTGKGPTGRVPDEIQSDQRAMDLVDEACMESFPCSDPPSYTRCHA